MARRATRNAQQTIYRLYFGAFGTQCKGRKFDSEREREGGGDCHSNFVWTDKQRGLGREIYFHVA